MLKLSKLHIAILKFPTTLHMVCTLCNFTLVHHFFANFVHLCSLLCCWFSWWYQQEVFGKQLIPSTLPYDSWLSYFHGEKSWHYYPFTILRQRIPSVNSKPPPSTCIHLSGNEHSEPTEVDWSFQSSDPIWLNQTIKRV